LNADHALYCSTSQRHGHCRKAEQDMDADNRQEKRIGGRDRDAENDCYAEALMGLSP
jgi:hypothetical protein